MKSLWNDADAAQFGADDLAMRVYSSRLLGSSADLVMHGGGNTSVKGTARDFFGNDVRCKGVLPQRPNDLADLSMNSKRRTDHDAWSISRGNGDG